MDDQKRLPARPDQEASSAARPASHHGSPPDSTATRRRRFRWPTTSSTVSTATDDGTVGADDSMLFSHPNAAANAITSHLISEGEAIPILHLEGTWCTNTVAHGSDLLRRWVASVEAAELVVDLSDIEFCDGRGISMLLELRLIAARRGCLLRLCRPNQIVTRLFTICDLDNLLEDDFPVAPTSRHRQDQRRIAQ